MRFTKPFLTSLFLFCALHGKAQSENIHRESIFIGLNIDTPLNDRITFSNLIQYRQINFTENSKLFLYRPNFQFALVKNLAFGVGYWYIKTQIPIESKSIITRSEHRIWEYLKYNVNLKNIELKNRLAFEQRMRSELDSRNIEPIVNKSSYNQRIRYRINLDFNLFKLPNTNPVKATISEEIRFRFTSGLSDPKFDQFNSYFYLNTDVGKKMNLRIGYGFDYAKITSNLFLVNKALRIRMNYNLNLRK